MPKRGQELFSFRRPRYGQPRSESTYTAARYIDGAGTRAGGAQSQASVADILRSYPVFVPIAISIDRIGVHVLTAQASAQTRAGIWYADDDGLPDALVVDSGALDTSTTGFKEATISEVLSPGLYFFGYVHSVSSVALRCRSVDHAPSLGYAAGSDINPATGINRSFTFAALPDPFGSPTYEDSISTHPVRVRVA